ncbi:NADH:flavin oxidoreductase [Citrobacter freundii]|uniref:NADH:flavin oxidoreductase n=1 Tax=Citrobacter TaxID=544 RepID=UPI00214D2D8F|nr:MULTISPECIES: NADH:flavin oxidoreductase [Citrobacter]MCR3713753.1 NADH:flavin oxidoreductase [Citrobacter freundii]MDM3231779.1 NADH:flavin oxidoreductase [Citrobacter sp. Cf078]
MHFPLLFRKGQINKIIFKNRAMVAPMTRISASETGMPGNRMKRYYADFARGGFGAIVTEGMYVDQAWSQTYAFQPGIVNTEQAMGWKGVVQDVKAAGAVIIGQLIHAGALSQHNIYRDTTVAPSAIQPQGQQLTFYHGKGTYQVPHALDEQQIQDVIRAFADSAERAVTQAGFDGVEIHAANGYLLDQFFTDYMNQRTDRWGGDIKARLGLTLEVIKAVRTRIGRNVILGVRISQGKVNDYHHKWAEGEDGAIKVFRSLQEVGVDYIHITEYRSLEPAFSHNQRSLVQIAREAAPSITIIANGGLDNGELAEQQLGSCADYVAIGKAALANHDWPTRVEKGLPLRDLAANVLAPIAEIKEFELEHY